jgi:hypothetical protein
MMALLREKAILGVKTQAGRVVMFLEAYVVILG